MNFIIISSFLMFSVVFFFSLQRTKSIEAKRDQEYWERESRANSTRKKSLDNLNYITVPEELLNMSPKNTTEEINSYISDLNDLSKSKIVNLTGLTNTDLKLQYGTANITILTEYDFNYTNLVTLLQKLAQITVERGCGRLEWCCLDWNQPSIDIYKSLGAVPMDEWTIYRLTGADLQNLAEK